MLNNIKLWGTLEEKNFGSLQFAVVPCNQKLTHLGGLTDRIAPGCVEDLSKQVEYLDAMNFIVYYNVQEIKINEYIEYPIRKQSRIY